MSDSNKRALRDLSLSFIEETRSPKKSKDLETTPRDFDSHTKLIMQSTPTAHTPQTSHVPVDQQQQANEAEHQPHYVINTPVTISAEGMQSIVEAVKAAIRESLRDEISTIVSEKIKPLNDQVDKLRCENHQLRMQLDELEQYGRRPLVRISGIRETNGEDPKVKILEVTTKTGIDLCPDDIITSHRVGKPRSKPRQIIVRLNSVDTKFSLLRSAKKLGKHSETSNIRINEDLTKFRDRLMYLSRQLCRFGRLRKVWSTNGKITVKDNRDKAHNIREESDLVQFGHEITRD